MTTRARLEALVERVRQAMGPDREIDQVIAVLEWGPCDFGSGIYAFPHPYTSSLDAVVALIERELPGWAWKVVRDYVRGNCCAVVRNAGSLDTIAPAWVHTAATPPLALLAAFLSAKLSSLPEEA